jgi:hypothetical protein
MQGAPPALTCVPCDTRLSVSREGSQGAPAAILPGLAKMLLQIVAYRLLPDRQHFRTSSPPLIKEQEGGKQFFFSRKAHTPSRLSLSTVKMS